MKNVIKTRCFLVASTLATVLLSFLLLVAQESKNSRDPVYEEEILRTFRFPADSKATKSELNKKLIEIIRERRIRFLLTDKIRKELRDAGANDELLNVIDTCLTPREKVGIIDDAATVAKKRQRLQDIIALEDRIYELFPKKDIESRKRFIEVGKEYLKKYGSDDDTKEMADYLRAVLPKLEFFIKKTQEID